MYLGKVLGSVVASQKHPSLRGIKLRFVQPIDDTGRETGPPHVAVDVVRADVGQIVYLVGSREASMALEDAFSPVDAAIVGIVDAIDD
ncbi:MAG: ethanolamine utilization protein EutN [Deltaproteobacteria bacterium]|nr:MAG: ethanolamine utilization protein EutN [Deltaproteobacteria bacterium]